MPINASFSCLNFQDIIAMSLRTLFLVVMILNMLGSGAASESDAYVVHMDRTEMETLHASLESPHAWYDSIIESITGGGEAERPPELLYVYKNTLSGFSAKLSNHHLQWLQRVDGFLSAIKDELLTLHTTHSPQFLGLHEGQGLWDSQNLASDVIIGVVDTGIWPEHPSFSSAGVAQPVPSRWKGTCETGTKFNANKCNKKLIGARTFFKGYEAIVGRINETSDYRSPRDASGHGTHTASTAGGNAVKGANLFGLGKGTAAGIRPTARIAAYKACYQLGCVSSDILAAVDQAVSDGVDILSLSLGGSSRPYYNDNLAIATFGAVQKGVLVSMSAGNSGPSKSTVTNVAPWLITVAASYMDRSFPTKVRLDNGRVFSGASLYAGKATKQLPLTYGGDATRFCLSNSLSKKQVKGKIVVCDRGINGRVSKGEQVKLAGGKGMILANTGGQGEELFADPHILPATSLGASTGDALKAYINATVNATAVIEFEGTVFNAAAAPAMAAFSSRGPSAVEPEIIKPDVTAPGVNILAAWPTNISPSEVNSDNRRVRFNIVSGTSMSCPHVAGVAALLKSFHGGWSPSAIKSALMTTAYTGDSKGQPISDVAEADSASAATSFAFGSGHVDPTRASDPGLVYEISPEEYLLHLCSLNFSATQIALFGGGNFTCPGAGDGDVPQSGDLNYPSFAVLLRRNSSPAAARNSTRTVTNVGGVSRYTVKLIEPDGVTVAVEPEVLSFGKLGEKVSYRVRFAAMAGAAVAGNFSFGELVWSSGNYSVRSPIAVTWLQ